MFLQLILIIIVCVCWSVYLKWSRVKNYWRERGVPHYPPHPVMGSLTFLQRENPSIWMRRAYNDFKSPYMGMWLFWRPALVVNTPEMARNILVKDSDNFRNHFLSSGKTDPIGNLNLFSVNDPVWTTLRRRLTGVLSNTKLRTHSLITEEKTKDLVQRIREEIMKNPTLHIRELLVDYTTDIIGESAFGINSEAVKTGDSVMKQVTKEFMQFNTFRGLSWSSIFFFPELVDVFRFSLFPKSTTEKLRSICRSVIQQRGGYERKVDDPKDLLDALIKMKQVATSEGEEMSEDFILAQASILLSGGFDTTASALSWIVYELAWHPECQQRLYEEILNVMREKGDHAFDPNSLNDYTYFDCVIKETLRFFPPMGWLDRVAAQDYKVDENLIIPAGTPVYVNSVAMQIDPQYFPDPMVFNPDRFLPQNEKNIIPYSFMPFGEGPRICIGMRFGYRVIRRALSSLVYNFDIRRVPGTPKPTQVHVENQGMFFMPRDKRMIVEFVPRHV